jgi:hypothetical protein
MKRIVSVAVSLLLVGCATTADKITTGMTSLVGQPIDAAIARLGVPNDQQTIAGRTVYTWFRRNVEEGTEFKCQIRVIMNGNVIGSFDFDGNSSKCAYYARLLQGNSN